MRTERRDTPRIPITLPAILEPRRSNAKFLVTRDISLDGVFVETIDAPKGRLGGVDVSIKLPTDGQDQFHRFHGRVVRTTDRGTGLLFDKVDSQAYAALLDMVYTRQRRGSM